jgi:hypothetical protein
MKVGNPSARILRLGILLLSIAGANLSYSETRFVGETNSPVGQWVVAHPSREGIGSWWDFRSDGTFTMHIGAIVTSPIKRSGDTFTSPATTIKGSPIPMTYRVEGNMLKIKAPNSPAQTFVRIGSAPSADDPLLGKWQPLPPATFSNDPTIATQQRMMASATLVFCANNTQTLRIPFSNYEGVWDAVSHTFHVNNQTSHTFQRSGPRLTLSQPPRDRGIDTFLPDSGLSNY